jgi:hypothetical protein
MYNPFLQASTDVIEFQHRPAFGSTTLGQLQRRCRAAPLAIRHVLAHDAELIDE